MASPEGPTEEKSPETIETLNSEHLVEEVSPIIASVIDSGEIDEFTERSIKKITSEGVDVSYYGSPSEWNENKMRNAGTSTYVISDVDQKSKYSRDYKNCTSVVAVGKDLSSEADISFLSHQDPDKFLKKEQVQEKFKNDLEEQLNKLKDLSREGSIDVVIVGGNYFGPDTKYAKDYISSLDFLNESIAKTLGLEAAIILGPKTISGTETSVYFDSSNRHLFLVQKLNEDVSGVSFSASKVNEHSQEWDENYKK